MSKWDIGPSQRLYGRDYTQKRLRETSRQKKKKDPKDPNDDDDDDNDDESSSSDDDLDGDPFKGSYTDRSMFRDG